MPRIRALRKKYRAWLGVNGGKSAEWFAAALSTEEYGLRIALDEDEVKAELKWQQREKAHPEKRERTKAGKRR